MCFTVFGFFSHDDKAPQTAATKPYGRQIPETAARGGMRTWHRALIGGVMAAMAMNAVAPAVMAQTKTMDVDQAPIAQVLDQAEISKLHLNKFGAFDASSLKKIESSVFYAVRRESNGDLATATAFKTKDGHVLTNSHVGKFLNSGVKLYDAQGDLAAEMVACAIHPDYYKNISQDDMSSLFKIDVAELCTIDGGFVGPNFKNAPGLEIAHDFKAEDVHNVGTFTMGYPIGIPTAGYGNVTYSDGELVFNNIALGGASGSPILATDGSNAGKVIGVLSATYYQDDAAARGASVNGVSLSTDKYESSEANTVGRMANINATQQLSPHKYSFEEGEKVYQGNYLMNQFFVEAEYKANPTKLMENLKEHMHGLQTQARAVEAAYGKDSEQFWSKMHETTPGNVSLASKIAGTHDLMKFLSDDGTAKDGPEEVIDFTGQTR